ncbi:hypothetical protein OG194_18510 [Streptomyces sp. NBC_01288]|uniref:hypothetical protein n=1 Tax=Streptomyces sp. NBC_01288 TaxID=2903814 RepID=UPI002E15DD8D|nr:hypothetical protein OG194_18510 [Streptomyces sp. NBC_01288]
MTLTAALPSSIDAIAISALFDVLVTGIVQDTPIWLLASWLSGKTQAGFHVDGFLAALLGGVIVRATVLFLLALGPRPGERTP